MKKKKTELIYFFISAILKLQFLGYFSSPFELVFLVNIYSFSLFLDNKVWASETIILILVATHEIIIMFFDLMFWVGDYAVNKISDWSGLMYTPYVR